MLCVCVCVWCRVDISLLLDHLFIIEITLPTSRSPSTRNCAPGKTLKFSWFCFLMFLNQSLCLWQRAVQGRGELCRVVGFLFLAVTFFYQTFRSFYSRQLYVHLGHWITVTLVQFPMAYPLRPKNLNFSPKQLTIVLLLDFVQKVGTSIHTDMSSL